MSRVLSLAALLFLASALPASAQHPADTLRSDDRSVVDPAYPDNRIRAYHLLIESERPVRTRVVLLPSARDARYGSAGGRTYELSRVPVCPDDHSSFHRTGPGAQPGVLVPTMWGRINLFEEAAGHYRTGVRYFQIGDGCVSIATSARLRAAMAEHAEATRYLDYADLYGWAGVSAAVVGAALVVSGGAIEIGAMEGSHGLLMTGSGLLLAISVNSLVPGLQRRARTAAVHVYNR